MLLFKLLNILFHDPISFVTAFLLLVIPLLLSITIHEWAHGMVAYKFGDATPKRQGRLTLNPFAHLDLVGTIMLFTIGIGWAKPVEVNFENIKGRTRQLLVALAGPASNFAFAIVLTVVVLIINSNHITIFQETTSTMPGIITTLLGYVIRINLILAVFNLMPIPPLDGSSIIRWILPNFLMGLFNTIASFGFIILIIMLFTVGFNFVFDMATKLEFQIFKVMQQILSPFFI